MSSLAVVAPRMYSCAYLAAARSTRELRLPEATAADLALLLAVTLGSPPELVRARELGGGIPEVVALAAPLWRSIAASEPRLSFGTPERAWAARWASWEEWVAALVAALCWA